MPPFSSSLSLTSSPELSESSSSSSLDHCEHDADDEGKHMVLFVRQASSSRSSARSTPRSARDRSFDMTAYFYQYQMQCIDVTDDIRSISAASAKINALHAFAPEYFWSTDDGMLFDELRREYNTYLVAPLPPSNAMRIGQLTEKLRIMLNPTA